MLEESLGGCVGWNKTLTRYELSGNTWSKCNKGYNFKSMGSKGNK